MTRLRTKPLRASTMIVAAVALFGHAAVAANVHAATPSTHVVHSRAVAHSPPLYHVQNSRTWAWHDWPHPQTTYRRSGPPAQAFGVGGLIAAFFGGVLPVVLNGQQHASYQATRDQSTYVPMESPTYDTSPPIDDSASIAAAAQAANDTNAMIQTMQAAQAQNDEANAEVTAGILAAQQTEINAGM